MTNVCNEQKTLRFDYNDKFVLENHFINKIDLINDNEDTCKLIKLYYRLYKPKSGLGLPFLHYFTTPEKNHELQTVVIQLDSKLGYELGHEST